MFELAHFRTQNRDYTFVENALVLALLAATSGAAQACQPPLRPQEPFFFFAAEFEEDWTKPVFSQPTPPDWAGPYIDEMLERNDHVYMTKVKTASRRNSGFEGAYSLQVLETLKGPERAELVFESTKDYDVFIPVGLGLHPGYQFRCYVGFMAEGFGYSLNFHEGYLFGLSSSGAVTEMWALGPGAFSTKVWSRPRIKSGVR